MTDQIAPSRLVVTGAGGQLGRALLRLAAARTATDYPGAPAVIGYARTELDITDPDAVRAALRPGDTVVNCAAFTAVDLAETEVAAAYAGNETGPATLAAACAETGARLIHLSTDYVFPGNGSSPYETTDPTGPATVYGKSKLAGEQAISAIDGNSTIVRTAWVYTGTGTDFVATMLRLERERDTVSVVDDQLGCPTYAVDLAAGLLELAARPDAPRILHATNAGQASWFEFARAVFELAGADPDRVLPCDSAAFPRPAPRPAYSVLSNRSWAAAGLTPLRPWRAALADALDPDQPDGVD
ncbi:dTDP-4-dehydrorhamnose reductase [Nocardia arthritidis]|uniref:dTDP-4-dehydrorhamnose reductase n=1 Tax=Nocardia arthritidis TaxID=228602 RepID=UPI00142DA43C|nr:dTDP-4-dehydrorhamnose reductase [Nocardia arthritidis]